MCARSDSLRSRAMAPVVRCGGRDAAPWCAGAVAARASLGMCNANSHFTAPGVLLSIRWGLESSGTGSTSGSHFKENMWQLERLWGIVTRMISGVENLT